MIKAIDAHIEGGSVTVCVEKDDRQKVRKQLYVDEFIDYLKNSLEEAEYTRIGALPYGYYEGALGKAGNNKVVLVIPAGVREMSYFDEDITVPYPELVFFLKTDSSNLVQSHVMAKVGDKLYHYPYGNVYADAHICWGRNQIKDIRNMVDFNMIPQLFFGSGTNNDLYSAGTNVIKKPEFVYQRGLLETVSKLDTFPEEYLVPFKVGGKKAILQEYTNNFLN